MRPTDEAGEFNGEQAAQDLRNDLAYQGNQLRLKKNVAVAEANINGKFIPSSELRAVSGEDPPIPGTVGEPSNPVLVPQSPDGMQVRPTDSEYKVLEHIVESNNLEPVPPGTEVGSRGTVNLYSEAEQCGSCSDVIRQFEQQYGVKVNATYSVSK